MMRTSERRLGVLRSVKISYPILVIFRSSPVIICFYLLRYKIWYEFVGFSDPVYAEAYVKMHGFNIMLGEPSEGDTRYNLTFLRRCSTRTPSTPQNLCLDFATLGNLKLVERPGVYTIAPRGFQSIKVNSLSFSDCFSQTLINPFA